MVVDGVAKQGGDRVFRRGVGWGQVRAVCGYVWTCVMGRGRCGVRAECVGGMWGACRA